MKNILRGIGLDTSAVLLFLAAEVGRTGKFGSTDTLIMGVSVLMLLVLPYFLPSASECGPSFVRWMAFRGLIAVFGLASGLVLPDSMRFLPMNLLILAGISSCVFQFYGLMKLRLAD